MGTKRVTVMSTDQALANRQAQARERQRRGLVTFTRPEVRESVMGGTQGENSLQTGTRGTQVGYGKKRKGR
jgi:hypothetical protein